MFVHEREQFYVPEAEILIEFKYLEFSISIDLAVFFGCKSLIQLTLVNGQSCDFVPGLVGRCWMIWCHDDCSQVVFWQALLRVLGTIPVCMESIFHFNFLRHVSLAKQVKEWRLICEGENWWRKVPWGRVTTVNSGIMEMSCNYNYRVIN